MRAARSVREVADVLRGCRFAYSDEHRLQAGVAAALEQAGFAVEREVRLDERCRIDALAGRVGVEVKVDGRVGDVRRQLLRYLASDRVDGLVLVTTRVRHTLAAPLPLRDQKPVEVVLLAGQGL